MRREDIFWRTLRIALGVLIMLSLINNLFLENVVPHQITLLLVGCLIAIGVGRSITDPHSSPIRLTRQEEKLFRNRQYLVSFTFSIVLVLSMLVKEVRDSMLVWLFLPIIMLPVILIVRERTKRWW